MQGYPSNFTVTRAEKLTIWIQFEITRPVAAIKSLRFALFFLSNAFYSKITFYTKYFLLSYFIDIVSTLCYHLGEFVKFYAISDKDVKIWLTLSPWLQSAMDLSNAAKKNEHVSYIDKSDASWVGKTNSHPTHKMFIHPYTISRNQFCMVSTQFSFFINISDLWKCILYHTMLNIDSWIKTHLGEKDKTAREQTHKKWNPILWISFVIIFILPAFHFKSHFIVSLIWQLCLCHVFKRISMNKSYGILLQLSKIDRSLSKTMRSWSFWGFTLTTVI